MAQVVSAGCVARSNHSWKSNRTSLVDVVVAAAAAQGPPNPASFVIQSYPNKLGQLYYQMISAKHGRTVYYSEPSH